LELRVPPSIVNEEPALAFQTYFAAASDRALNNLLELHREAQQELHDLKAVDAYMKVVERWCQKSPRNKAPTSNNTPGPSAIAREKTTRGYPCPSAPPASKYLRISSPLPAPEDPEDLEDIEEYIPEE
jgi:hypothetical protein